jgi:hypothetical protein
MGAGLGLGTLIPRLNHGLGSVQISGTGTSLPIAIGLLVMMYPVPARGRYDELGRLRAERGLFVSPLVLNWGGRYDFTLSVRDWNLGASVWTVRARFDGVWGNHVDDVHQHLIVEPPI